MKKLLFAFPIVALLAAGCNSTKQVSVLTQIRRDQNSIPTTTPNPSTTISSTSLNTPVSWLIYSYQNFSFKYPQDYTVEFQNQGTPQEFLTVRNTNLWIEVDYSSENPALDSSDITKYMSGLMVNNRYTHYDLNTSVAGQKTVHIAESGSGQTYDYDDYSFLKDGKYYRLDFSYHSDKASDEKVRNAFIQNFKFTNN